MEDGRIYRKNPDVITRVFEGETILMPLFKASKDIDCIYTLDDTGTRIWELINGKRSIDSIEKMLAQEYEVGQEKLHKSLAVFFKDLKDIKAVLPI